VDREGGPLMTISSRQSGKMERREQHRFRRELVEAFLEAGLQQARAAKATQETLDYK
jgi:uncharacterized protein YodC (DUF2158 family)